MNDKALAAAMRGDMCACPNELPGWHYVMGDCSGPFAKFPVDNWGAPRPATPVEIAIDVIHASRKRSPIEWPETK